MKKVLILLSPFLLLAASMLLDRTFYRFEKFQATQAPVIPFGAEIVVYLVLAGLLLGLAWYVLCAVPRRLPVAAVYIAAGAFMLFSTSIPGYFWWGATLSGFPTLHAWLAESVASPFAFTRNSAAMILIIGLARLLPQRRLRPLGK